ncbi:MAG: glutamine amidotransferase [Ruminococcus sp.]|nr:glutamine amidotransferase [Ruminococcus sp.]MBQ1975271.1 glutamine amidotransferase [Ruminococcus sp.]MBQ2359098.1 glutamine amidotransferase [Ruminococcus sp.]
MKILHFYHDLMNLYGDYANVSAMRRILEKSGESVTVDRRSLGDNVDFSDYDFIYIGSGTERNQRVALADLHRHADALRQYIADGRPALLTGNSFEMLGRTITDAAGNKHKGLGVFDFTVTEQNKTRVTADVIFTCEFLAEPLVGFVNKCSEIRGADPTLFNVKMGLGNFEGDKREGVRVQNCYGTHLTGPVLIKNPHFLAFLAEKLLGRAPETGYLTYEKAGFAVTLSELSRRADAQ